MGLFASSRGLLLSSLLVVLLLAPAPAAPRAVQKTLSNGLRVVVVPNPLAPVVTVDMTYLAGAVQEPQEGIAHANEHMMFRGSASLSAAQMADILALTGGRFNAETEAERTHFYFTVPARDLEVVLRVEAARAQGLLDSPELWERERGAIIQESDDQLGDGEYRLYRKAREHLFRGTPYADDGLGTHAGFEKITAPELQLFYRTWYHPNNAVLVVCGDVDADAATALVEKYFGSVPTGSLPSVMPVTVPPSSKAVYTDQTDHQHSASYAFYRFPGYDDPDYAASQVLWDVLSSQRSPLNDLVAEGQALNVDVACESYRPLGLLSVMVAASMDVTPQETLRLGRQALDVYRKHGVPPELVAVARRERVAAVEHKANAIEGLALEWAEALQQGRSSPADDADRIRQVTVEDVNRVLRRWLVDDTATVCYAVPHGGNLKAAPKGRKAENPSAAPTTHDPLPDWALPLLTSPLELPSPPTPFDMRLSNGLRLVVVPLHASRTVVLRGEIRHESGLQAPPGQEGVDEVTDDLLAYGPAHRSRRQWLADLDAVTASADVEPTSGTSFGCNVLASDFDRAVQLLAEDEMTPALRPADFEVVREQAWDDAVARRHEPHRLAEEVLGKALYPQGDPRLRRSTPSSVEHLTLSDVQRWHTRVYRPDMTTVVVVGDIQPQQARASVQRWFGPWRAIGPRPRVELPRLPDNAAAVKVVPDPGRLQDEVRMVETLGVQRTDPDAAALRLANAILTDGFFVSMLFHDLRETTGYVYDVDSWLTVERTRAFFGITYAASPSNTQKAADVIERDLRALQADLLPPDRLKLAKLLRLGELPLNWASYQDRAEDLLDCAMTDEPLDADVRDVAAELAVTAEQLRAAMVKWIRPSAFVRVILAARPK